MFHMSLNSFDWDFEYVLKMSFQDTSFLFVLRMISLSSLLKDGSEGEEEK